MDRSPQGVIGVDEAGRGPVLGPMVVAAVAVSDLDQLPDGIADSKQLSPEQRLTVASRLRESSAIEICTEIVPPIIIDLPESNLNSLTIDAMATVVDHVASPKMVSIVDAGGPDPVKFAERLKSQITTDIDIIAEHGADDTYAIVGAASIIAKVERDQRLSKLSEKYGPVGSGYPSDPTTRKFMKTFIGKNGKLPPCARASWKTSKDLLSAQSQIDLGEYTD